MSIFATAAPIPLSLDERHYPHQVIQLDLARDELVAIEALRVPRFVDILRFPDTGAGEVEELENRLAAYPFDPGLAARAPPLSGGRGAPGSA